MQFEKKTYVCLAVIAQVMLLIFLRHALDAFSLKADSGNNMWNRFHTIQLLARGAVSFTALQGEVTLMLHSFNDDPHIFSNTAF